ncbi:MAG TPA: phage holin family protein [Candidatus Paceibacterota bacterium]|nr:phage holin family protein [Candidatus Paceibacterota bacterium]
MVDIAIRILGNSVALYGAALVVPGFVINGGIREYIIAGVVLGLLNLIVKPILKAISFPIIILTLGLFSLVINGAMVWTVDYLFDFITIHSLWALAWGTILITVINVLLTHAVKD